MSLREFVRPSDRMLFVSDMLRDAKPALAPPRARAASLYDRVRERRRAIENEQWNVEEKKRRLEELSAEAQGLQRRHEALQKRQCLRAVERLREEIAELESGRRLDDFQEKAQRYLQEYQRQQFCRSAEEEELGEAAREGRVLEDFMTHVEAVPPKFQIVHSDVCAACEESMQLHQTLSMLICPKCGAARPFLDATASLLAYSDDYDYTSFSYKRINHFQEVCASLQGKETMEIPEAVLEAVMQRLVDERTTSAEEITVHRVRDVLKKLKLRKYYEHVMLITCKITGRPAPKMTPEMEERIKVCFLAASAAFQRHLHVFENRKNMISYTTVMAKLCEFLGYHEFLPYFTPLKSLYKVAEADKCWRLICEDLGWPFVPAAAAAAV